MRPDPTPLLSLSRLDFSCVPVCVCVCVTMCVCEREREPDQKPKARPDPSAALGYRSVQYDNMSHLHWRLRIGHLLPVKYTIAFNYKAVPEQ